MTTYDLPRPDAAPYDEVFDAGGNVWHSDFNTQYMGKVDPKTGEVVEYEIPLRRPNGVAHGGLQVEFDPEVKLWFANTEQIQPIRFEPETGKLNQYLLPHRTDIRHVEVWKGEPDELSSFWVGDRHAATLTHIEAQTP